jgi:hypothetical protein
MLYSIDDNLCHSIYTSGGYAFAYLSSNVGFGGATGYLAAMTLFRLLPQPMASTAPVTLDPKSGWLMIEIDLSPGSKRSSLPLPGGLFDLRHGLS